MSTPAISDRQRDRRANAGFPGLAVAGLTALVSGVSVFVNSYGVHAIAAPSVYTTAKNLVATLILGCVVLLSLRMRAGRPASLAARFASRARDVVVTDTAPQARRRMRFTEVLGLAYIGVVGGGIAFVLFFDGLAKTSATPAAFWRDTLVIWVAVLAVPFLREQMTRRNFAAIALLVFGQIALVRGVGHLALNQGELLVLVSSMLWAIEVVVAKRLLRQLAPGTVAFVRMAIGTITLFAYLGATGALSLLFDLDAGQLGWTLLTGLLLASYVGTWMTALSRARALDVSSMLVASALVTALLQAAAGTTTLAPRALGLALILAGAILVASVAAREPAIRSRGLVGR